MNELFLKIVNMSISASWLVLVVLILRFVLKKAPKWVNILLWGIVAIRLICPFSFESALSLIPSAETFPEKVISGPSFDVQTGITPVDNRINDYLGDRYFEGVTVPANNGNNIMTILTIVWTIGILLLVAYTVISYWRLRRKVDTAVRYKDNIFQSENVKSPFVLGIIKPRIYLPFNMNGQDLEHVVAHEQAHIHRKDHWWKPFGFLLLTIHWFNPLVWLAYVLLCRDMVNGTLYLDTGHESKIEARCGVMDGEITSQVDGNKQPSVDNQSNFGTGYGYQYGATEGTIELFMNGKWWIFATEEARQKIQFPSIEDELSKFYLTIGSEGVKSIKLSMPNSSGGFENADGSLLKKGERIWLENLDGYTDLRGLTITALGENGEIIWTASIPDEEENKGFTHLVNDDWEITNIE